MIRYTAKRSLSPGHVANEPYDLAFEVMDATPDVRDIKSIERSAGGAIETVFERQDIYWTIQLAPVNGLDAQRLVEFLDSIESGETFQVWVRDSDAEPLVLKMEGDAGTVDAFMRTGSENTDYFTGQFTALQSAPYTLAGLESGGYVGGDGDTVDVFDPSEGGSGGLDEPPALGLILSAADFVDEFESDYTGYSDGSGPYGARAGSFGGVSGSLAINGNTVTPRAIYLEPFASSLYMVFELDTPLDSDWFDLEVDGNLVHFVLAADESEGVFTAYGHITTPIVDGNDYLVTSPAQVPVALSSFTVEIECGSSGNNRGFESSGFGAINSNSGSDQVVFQQIDTTLTTLRFRPQGYNGPTNPPNFHPQMFTSIDVEGIGTFYSEDADLFTDAEEGEKNWNCQWSWPTAIRFPASGTRTITVNV